MAGWPLGDLLSVPAEGERPGRGAVAEGVRLGVDEPRDARDRHEVFAARPGRVVQVRPENRVVPGLPVLLIQADGLRRGEDPVVPDPDVALVPARRAVLDRGRRIVDGALDGQRGQPAVADHADRGESAGGGAGCLEVHHDPGQFLPGHGPHRVGRDAVTDVGDPVVVRARRLRRRSLLVEDRPRVVRDGRVVQRKHVVGALQAEGAAVRQALARHIQGEVNGRHDMLGRTVGDIEPDLLAEAGVDGHRQDGHLVGDGDRHDPVGEGEVLRPTRVHGGQEVVPAGGQQRPRRTPGDGQPGQLAGGAVHHGDAALGGFAEPVDQVHRDVVARLLVVRQGGPRHLGPVDGGGEGAEVVALGVALAAHRERDRGAAAGRHLQPRGAQRGQRGRDRGHGQVQHHRCGPVVAVADRTGDRGRGTGPGLVDVDGTDARRDLGGDRPGHVHPAGPVPGRRRARPGDLDRAAHEGGLELLTGPVGVLLGQDRRHAGHVRGGHRGAAESPVTAAGDRRGDAHARCADLGLQRVVTGAGTAAGEVAM